MFMILVVWYEKATPWPPLNNGFPIQSYACGFALNNNAIMLRLAGVMIEDPTETIFDFVEFPLVDDDVVEINSVSDSAHQSSDSRKQNGDKTDVSGSIDSVYVYYSPNSGERCKWFVRRIMASRVLLGLGVVFIGLSILMCGLGMVKSDSNRTVKERKVSSMRTSMINLCSLYNF